LARRRAFANAAKATRTAAPVSSHRRVNKTPPYRTACNSVNRLRQYASLLPAARQ
jgi:hypothetical protein